MAWGEDRNGQPSHDRIWFQRVRMGDTGAARWGATDYPCAWIIRAVDPTGGIAMQSCHPRHADPPPSRAIAVRCVPMPPGGRPELELEEGGPQPRQRGARHAHLRAARGDRPGGTPTPIARGMGNGHWGCLADGSRGILGMIGDPARRRREAPGNPPPSLTHRVGAGGHQESESGWQGRKPKGKNGGNRK